MANQYKKIKLTDVQELANQFNGSCTSNNYMNAKSKMQFICDKGHKFMQTFDRMRQGSWCRECAGNMPLTLKDMQMVARQKGGKCLSKEYFNIDEKLIWECENGHVWEARASNVKNNNTWCLKCSGSEKLTIEKMNEIAKPRGGRCISKRYVNNHTHLKWECVHGHVWPAKPTNVITGGWCPTCSEGISERICRAYFNQLFNNKFVKVRPSWLRNSKGSLMELDGYCKDLRLAFEHQGRQHYDLSTPWINDETQLSKRVSYDREKNDICKKKGIRLIAIPALFFTTPLKDLQQFIYDECKKLHVRRPAGFLGKVVNLKGAWKSDGRVEILHELKAIAKKYKGKCLSKEYINAHNTMQWECNEGHQWETSAHSVKQGHWCRKCSYESIFETLRLTIEEMQKIAESRNGKCLSTTYKNARTKLEWECANGHRWKAKPDHVKGKKSWCKICSRANASNNRKLEGLAEAKAIAKKRKGVCLSEEYLSIHKHLIWECENGHQWSASMGNVKHNKSWCPHCRKITKKHPVKETRRNL
jgi:hypothetical protein